MLSAPTNDRVLAYLGRALSLELSAVQLYSTQARVVAFWGLSEAAAYLRNEADEELQHANRIIECMLAAGVMPGASQLRPVRLADDLHSLLTVDLQFEAELIEFYREAAGHCEQIGDPDHQAFFLGLLEDEQLHHEELLSWRASLASAGRSSKFPMSPKLLEEATYGRPMAGKKSPQPLGEAL